MAFGDDRKTSGFGLSVATGLSMETLFTPTDAVIDSTREFEKISMKPKDILMVSWYTLIRNIVGSLSDRDRAKTFETNKSREIAYIANKEIRILRMLTSDKDIELVVFAPDYSKVEGFVFGDRTKPTQKNIIFGIADMSKQYINKEFTIQTRIRIEESVGVTILTHIAMDLLNTRYSKIRLLESNTGKVYEPKDFNRKYRKSAYDYSMLPFTAELLFAFGDESGLLTSMRPKEKKMIVDKLTEKRVTPNTKPSAIRDILMRLEHISDYYKGEYFKY